MFPSSKNLAIKYEEDSQQSQMIKSELNIVGMYLTVQPQKNPELIPQYFSCLLNRLIKRTKTLKEKLIEKHNLQNVPLGQYLYKCKRCDKAYDKPTSLGGHISRAHTRLDQLNANDESPLSKKEDVGGMTRLEQNIIICESNQKEKEKIVQNESL